MPHYKTSKLVKKRSSNYFYVKYLARVFCKTKNSRPKVYKDVHFKTDTDVRGSMQRRVFAEQNSSLSNVHGGTLLNTATDGGGSNQ